ncbi:DNA primase [Lactobacillus sp. PV012]|uniref:DNA primase n=1 Tax=Lactobacillus sp. PV012 TaxID=2594494 RepID=UPI00224046B6|nr:DNA primase [Lactobacillus sp. PV012]QNQ82183.1 DNA primase [Lactobacillus sp. PV012]
MAGRIPEELINEVRNSVNIVNVIGQYVSLEKKGKDYIGLCPFHQEKTPSFTVNEEKQFFKCFGCGKGGNVFKFIMEKEHLNFPESVRIVAQTANIPLPETQGSRAYTLSPLKQMYKDTAEFYNFVLVDTQLGERGRQYAQKRDLDDEIIEHFKIGYAPERPNDLFKYLSKKYDEQLLSQSGLFVQGEDGALYDRFRDRLMFPLGDEAGYTVGFSGRRISENKEIAKYVNSPETKIFNKSKLLFHFSEAKKEARSKQKNESQLILYEGYMDVIAAYKAGVKTGIASMGTSLTDSQVSLIKQVTPNIIINYDGDSAGVHASERAIKMFASKKQVNPYASSNDERNLSVVSLPDGMDPDEYVKKYSAKAYRQALSNAQPAIDFLLSRLAKRYDLTNTNEKEKFARAAISLIVQATDDSLKQGYYLNEIAKKTEISVDLLKPEWNRQQIARNRVNRKIFRNTLSQSRRLDDEQVTSPAVEEQVDKNVVLDRLLYLFIHSNKARDLILSKHFLFPVESYARLEEQWLQFQETHQNPNVESFVDFVSPTNLSTIVTNFEMNQMPPIEDETLEQEIDDLIQAVNAEKLDNELKKLKEEIEDAIQKNDNNKVLQLSKKIINLRRTEKEGGLL